MVSALFTALALIAAGQGGSAPAGTAATQMQSGASEAPSALRASGRVAKAEHRNR